MGKKLENPSDQDMSVREAGRLGGLQTLRRRGREHFINAGRLGQDSMSRIYTSEDRRRWGRLGGRPRKNRLVFTGEEGTNHEGRTGEPAL